MDFPIFYLAYQSTSSIKNSFQGNFLIEREPAALRMGSIFLDRWSFQYKMMGQAFKWWEQTRF